MVFIDSDSRERKGQGQAQGQAQVATLEGRIKALEELNEQLEHDKAIFIDAHAVLKSRLGATEDEKRLVQEELKAQTIWLESIR